MNSYIYNQMKLKEYHTVGTVSKSNSKIIEKAKINIPNTQIHDRSLSWLGKMDRNNDLTIDLTLTCTF